MIVRELGSGRIDVPLSVAAPTANSCPWTRVPLSTITGDVDAGAIGTDHLDTDAVDRDDSRDVGLVELDRRWVPIVRRRQTGNVLCDGPHQVRSCIGSEGGHAAERLTIGWAGTRSSGLSSLRLP